jgi:hypothetical protein
VQKRGKVHYKDGAGDVGRKVTSIDGILKGHNRGHEKHKTYTKKVRWSDKCP